MLKFLDFFFFSSGKDVFFLDLGKRSFVLDFFFGICLVVFLVFVIGVIYRIKGISISGVFMFFFRL